LSLRDVWASEDKDALFLYIHIPFCEMRCGFCNLFTTANPEGTIPDQYLAAMERQAAQVRDSLGEVRIARMAIGGGTPTYLTPPELERLFDIAGQFGFTPGEIPVSVETSPHTAQPDRLAVLRQHGITRISIGIQSFIDAEAHSAGRTQRNEDVIAALDRIHEASFPTLNIDLIYGLENQTIDTWLYSLDTALRWSPEEIYLYPLYVRPLTGLGRHDTTWDDQRLSCYLAGRDFLLAHGYEQISMRMFRLAAAPNDDGIAYCCQEDGMIGLGCGARSYTRALHYSSEYAVGRAGIRDILADYIKRPDDAFAHVDYGFQLDMEDQRRRYIIKSILRRKGLNIHRYEATFGANPLEDFSQLTALIADQMLVHEQGYLVPTPLGLQYSDAIGPLLYSDKVSALSEAYELR
jgi:oxygen-independent coproporphyrinogen-3 oxidase